MHKFDRLIKLTVKYHEITKQWYLTITRNGHNVTNYENEIPIFFNKIISNQQYYSILNKHGASKKIFKQYHSLDLKEKAQKALDELEKYIIAAMLIH